MISSISTGGCKSRYTSPLGSQRRVVRTQGTGPTRKRNLAAIPFRLSRALILCWWDDHLFILIRSHQQWMMLMVTSSGSSGSSGESNDAFVYMRSSTMACHDCFLSRCVVYRGKWAKKIVFGSRSYYQILHDIAVSSRCRESVSIFLFVVALSDRSFRSMFVFLCMFVAFNCNYMW